MDWGKRKRTLLQAIKSGELFILGIEDLGRNHLDGLLQPGERGDFNQLDVLQHLTREARNDQACIDAQRNIMLLKIGKGGIVVYRNGPDSTNGKPADFAAWHQRFLKNWA